ncbi:MAG: hypothetical protein WCC64_19650 [Aliidongia sp.]
MTEIDQAIQRATRHVRDAIAAEREYTYLPQFRRHRRLGIGKLFQARRTLQQGRRIIRERPDLALGVVFLLGVPAGTTGA